MKKVKKVKKVMPYTASCPECGSFGVNPTTRPVDGNCEYQCDDCGHYFVDDAPAAEGDVSK